VKKSISSDIRLKAALGRSYGPWKAVELIGRGGNGLVLSAVNDLGEQAAVKVLSRIKKTAYRRFRDEIDTLKKVAEVPGILSILDSDLPAAYTTLPPWYAMPLGKPIEHWSEQVGAAKKVAAIAEVADTLGQLHEQGIAHRDVKPPNLLIHNDRCHLVDFGLVIYPGKIHLTGSRERIGPYWTMAPEVRRHHGAADPFPGDVYALAKTLWSVLRGDGRAFDGQYSTGSSLSIATLFPQEYTTPLEDLLVAATENRPAKRPSMVEFASGLASWLKIYKNFAVSNPLQWAEALNQIFPQGLPRTVEWSDAVQITDILKQLGAPNLNHMFYPSGGGNDLSFARLSQHEPGCIEIMAAGWSLLRPHRLTFHGFAGDPEWSYFRLEADTLERTKVYKKHPESLRDAEEVTRVNLSTYAERSCWDNDWYRGAPLPKAAHPITRWFGGSFVVFQKSSFYNLARGRHFDAYDGRHNRMTDEQFLKFISEMRKVVKENNFDIRAARYKHMQSDEA
jgi:serine/threonine-protein kinase